MHDAFVTTTRGLQRGAAPMRLFEKAKRYGILTFEQDEAQIHINTTVDAL